MAAVLLLFIVVVDCFGAFFCVPRVALALFTLSLVCPPGVAFASATIAAVAAVLASGNLLSRFHRLLGRLVNATSASSDCGHLHGTSSDHNDNNHHHRHDILHPFCDAAAFTVLGIGRAYLTGVA